MSEDKHDKLFEHTYPQFQPTMDFSVYPDAEADPRDVTYPKGHPKHVDMGVIAVESTEATQPTPIKESDDREYVSANRFEKRNRSTN